MSPDEETEIVEREAAIEGELDDPSSAEVLRLLGELTPELKEPLAAQLDGLADYGDMLSAAATFYQEHDVDWEVLFESAGLPLSIHEGEPDELVKMRDRLRSALEAMQEREVRELYHELCAPWLPADKLDLLLTTHFSQIDGEKLSFEARMKRVVIVWAVEYAFEKADKSTVDAAPSKAAKKRAETAIREALKILITAQLEATFKTPRIVIR